MPRPTTRLRTVTLPLLRPALAAAASIVFLFSFTSFGVILVLGGPRFSTLETEIYNQAVRSFDLGTAAVLALLQLAAVAVAATIAGRLERGLGVVGRRATRHPAPEGRMRLVVAGVVILSLGLLALPLLAVLRQALQVGDGWGLDHFAALADETPALLVTPVACDRRTPSPTQPSPRRSRWRSARPRRSRSRGAVTRSACS